MSSPRRDASAACASTQRTVICSSRGAGASQSGSPGASPSEHGRRSARLGPGPEQRRSQAGDEVRENAEQLSLVGKWSGNALHHTVPSAVGRVSTLERFHVLT